MEVGENEPGEVIDTAPVDEIVETPVVDPVVVETVEPESTPEPEPKRKGPSDSLIGELTAQRARRREAESKAERLDRELSEAKALIERLASKDPNAAAQPTPRSTYQPQDEDAKIQAAVAKARYDEKTVSIYERGHGAFGTAEFNDATTQFAGTVGDGVVPLVSDIMDVAGDNAHKVIFELSADPARAIAIRDMSPTKRAIAIHKMVEMSEAPVAVKSPLSAPAAKISKAPTPAPQIQVAAKTEKVMNWASSDKMSESEFNEFFNSRQKERRGMHR